ncbi:hypothetical protein BT96DRAFT_948804 [Gymnopus androsaceus JB14]|uniref:Uncharacterized protein n=1 Tax=Gymnopus androsaceus JB14 TaxID=1447944 RepID=A0A6A4GNT0_9AGAR|nr:hypothetical protein BT96DRAFT_948804 [Gymnopus androsaceus JB14]
MIRKRAKTVKYQFSPSRIPPPINPPPPARTSNTFDLPPQGIDVTRGREGMRDDRVEDIRNVGLRRTTEASVRPIDDPQDEGEAEQHRSGVPSTPTANGSPLLAIALNGTSPGALGSESWWANDQEAPKARIAPFSTLALLMPPTPTPIPAQPDYSE